jgi:hypothetical protein
MQDPSTRSFNEESITYKLKLENEEILIFYELDEVDKGVKQTILLIHLNDNSKVHKDSFKK